MVFSQNLSICCNPASGIAVRIHSLVSISSRSLILTCVVWSTVTLRTIFRISVCCLQSAVKRFAGSAKFSTALHVIGLDPEDCMFHASPFQIALHSTSPACGPVAYFKVDDTDSLTVNMDCMFYFTGGSKDLPFSERPSAIVAHFIAGSVPNLMIRSTTSLMRNMFVTFTKTPLRVTQ